MLYRALRLLLRALLQIFFVEIRVVGMKNVPSQGPLIFAANHPNSIMDTVILGTRTDRQVHYLARSGLFENRLVAWIFDKCGVIPLYRRSDGGAQGDQERKTGNQASFRAAFQLLAQGKCLGIFPEGRNAPERQVRDIRTGTARIALGAIQAGEGVPPEVAIVPVGLNFEDRDRFLSSVVVRFGEPIDVLDFVEEEGHGDEPTGPDAVRQLTDRIQDAIRDVAVHIQDEQVIELVEQVQRIYGKELRTALLDVAANRPELDGEWLRKARSGHEPDIDDEFYFKQRIADAAQWIGEHDAARLRALRGSVRRFTENLAQVRLREDFADRPPKTLSLRKEAIKVTLYAVLLAPIFAWGVVHNVAPFLLARSIALRAPDEAIRAFTGLVAGFFAGCLTYTALGFLLWAAGLPVWGIALYLSTLPFAGVFALRYRRQLARYRDRIIIRTMVITRSRSLQLLVAQRNRLLHELDELREAFMNANYKAEERHAAPAASLEE